MRNYILSQNLDFIQYILVFAFAFKMYFSLANPIFIAILSYISKTLSRLKICNFFLHFLDIIFIFKTHFSLTKPIFYHKIFLYLRNIILTQNLYFISNILDFLFVFKIHFSLTKSLFITIISYISETLSHLKICTLFHLF